MSRIILVRHEADPDDDRIVTFLRNKGIEPEIVRSYLGEKLGTVDSSIAASVVYGGPFNAHDEDKHLFLRDENRWIEGCLKQNIPLLGICQGAHSIAHVLGAYAGPVEGNLYEFGYYPIKPSEAGKAYFPESLIVAESHFHEFQIPDGGELLASSELFGQQAMRYGENCFAFQFHAECIPAGFRRWQHLNQSYYGKPGVQSREQQNQFMQQHDRAQHQWFMQFQESFFADAVNRVLAG
jgi:GMP synthase (glutamine-hydrolysing)